MNTSKKDCYVSIAKHKGVARIYVEGLNGSKSRRRYPLTKAGCLQAGRDLFIAGAKHWLHSSSVDFPQEVKRSFNYDVHELMAQGYREGASATDYLMSKIMKHCAQDDFQDTLTPVEKEAFTQLVKQTGA